MDDLMSGLALHTDEIPYNQAPGVDVLRDASSPGAALGSSEHYDRRCFPGTREQYITDITNWVTESIYTPPSMYWMRGPVGVGKSTIAQTCAEKLAENDYLGAAFFFTVKEHSDPLRLFTTIAYQLTTTLPDYRAAVEDRIFKDNTIVEKKMPSQFKSLIVEQLHKLRNQGKSIQPEAIFINGLDECAGEDARAAIIKIVAFSIREGRIHSVPLGHLQSRRTLHCIDIQAGQYRFSHSFH